ncbi:molybdopterin molybdenumtransferase MoeA [Chitinophaga cymbidii]|uniref:Molybdopterin molybdenumtransferase n=2 Tax=Chitinophaga cymbidii TaxID=1096750 RepID=A0A512REF1_9BACT|nr:molybdopterin molybdenumtransferase MoeA [Chitinophaga cymbidii]
MPVSEAFAAIMSAVRDFGTEKVPLEAAAGRILRETVTADRPFPPFDRVTMDGIAIYFDSYARGQRVFGLEDVQAAGMPQMQLANLADCMEVMTGAILPDLTDTVIPYEHLEITEHEGFKRFTVVKDAVKGQNIHRIGSDAPAGKILLEAGIRIGAAEIGVLATVGKSEVLVSRLPKIVLIATGNELVEVSAIPAQHQLRMSNIHSLHASLQQLGIPAEKIHLPDDQQRLEQHISELLPETDVLICSGAVSAGKFDHLPAALKACGMREIFHKVQQRPGKPLLFGTFPQKPVVFALPGNPVSGFMCFYRYIRPWLKACLQENAEQPLFAVLEEEVVFNPALEYYLPVRLSTLPDGRTSAQPVPYNGSGDLSSLLMADAFMALPAERQVFEKNSIYPVWPFRTT